MIVTALIRLLDLILRMFGFLIASLSEVIPDQIQDGLAYTVGFLRYFRGVLPIDDIMSALGTFVSIIIVVYGIKLIIFVVSFLPFMGNNAKLPHVIKPIK